VVYAANGEIDALAEGLTAVGAMFR
jgi:hypothetical protein